MKSIFNGKPAVSVVMASWNRAYLLERCINSLLSQEFRDYELIFADDGSIDNTYAKFREYQNVHPNFIYLRHSHRGLALTRNAGINAANGEYITFLDTDDEYSPEHLKSRIDYMSEHPGVDLIHGGVLIIGNNFVPDKNDPQKDIHLSECIIGATIFAKKDVFRKLGSFNNIPYSEDSDFVERADKIYKIEKVNSPTYIYHRDVEDSITNVMEKCR